MIDVSLQAWRSRGLFDGPKLVSLLLASLIVVECVHDGFTLLTHHDMAASIAVNRNTAPRRPPGVDAQSIASAHLFGLAIDDPKVAAAEARPTPTDLSLQGTLATKRPTRGIAIINAAGLVKTYQVGEAVGDAALHAVYRDRVILDRHGRLETLALPHADTAAGSAARAPKQASNAVLADSGPHEPAGDQMHDLADLMSVDAAVDDDSQRLRGFTVHWGRTPRALFKSGLRQGDLLTAVNGTPLTNQDRDSSQEVVDAMLASGRASLSIVRNGKPLNISVDLSQ